MSDYQRNLDTWNDRFESDDTEESCDLPSNHFELLGRGYQEHYNEIDASVCEDDTCAECGHDHTVYFGYGKEGSYIAISKCPKCGDECEF